MSKNNTHIWGFFYGWDVQYLLESLITSKTRLKLLLKFFLNPENTAHLRGLAQEFGESTNAVRVELNRLSEAGLLEAKAKGRTKQYQANTGHPLYTELHSIVKKYLGLDKLAEQILSKLGNVELAFIAGDYAKGLDSGIIDLYIIGDIDKNYLYQLTEKVEKLIDRKIRYLVFTKEEFQAYKKNFDMDTVIIVWGK